MDKKKSPVIMLPHGKDRVLQLRRKLAQYKSRLRDPESNEHPDLYASRMMDTRCKIAVLERLLTEGRVVTWNLSRELARTWKIRPHDASAALFATKFQNACSVISDYCRTGGANTFGGKGLE